VAALADDHRDLVDADVEAIEHHLHAGIGLDVLIAERLPVAAEELPDVLRAPRVARAQEDQLVVLFRHQRHASQDEGAHEDLAELGVALDEGT
jgi:hypothetical protein